MRRMRLDGAATPGATLAHEVIGPAGEVVAGAGYPLTRRTADALLARGVSWCFVEDAASAGAVIAPLDGGGGAVRAVLRSFSSRISEVAAPFMTLPTARAVEAIRRTQPAAALRSSAAFTLLPEAAADLVARVAHVDPRGGYVTARHSAGDDDGHALGVAALTARIALLLGLAEADVVEVTTAALLHDIGLVFVPATVRRTSFDQWTLPERRRYEDHAILGGALLEPLAQPSLHLSMVAAEHHEAQDGSGYPAGITGGNRVLRGAEERRDSARITLFAEIVAVADRYERLLSPSPGCSGRSAAAARLALEAEAGSALNREIVARFLASFPALPLGSEVRFDDDARRGARGIVWALPAAGQPRVRQIADVGDRLIDPVEVTLTRDEIAALVPVDDAQAAEASLPAPVSR